MDEKHRIEPDEPLDALLDRVERGEEVVIARDGKPVARLIPEGAVDREATRAAVGRILARKRARLGNLKIKEMIEEGRE